jgi:hypothetical protein
MDKIFFKKQLDRLEVEYKDKGFTMTRERASQWFEFMKDIPEKTFERLINDCLANVSFCPNMADILKFKEKEFKNPYRMVD